MEVRADLGNEPEHPDFRTADAGVWPLERQKLSSWSRAQCDHRQQRHGRSHTAGFQLQTQPQEEQA